MDGSSERLVGAVTFAAMAAGLLICYVWKILWTRHREDGGDRASDGGSGHISFAGTDDGSRHMSDSGTATDYEVPSTMAEATTTGSSWSDLPYDLAAIVLRRLPPRHVDRIRFGAVCPQWRAAARDNPALPQNFPWLALPDRSFYNLPGSAFGVLPVHLDGHRQLPHAQSSCGEWLVFERRDGALTLMSPFSSAATIVLPGLHTLQNEPFEVAYDVQGPRIRKLVVCSHNLVAAVVVVDQTDLTHPYTTVRLALCRPGAATWSWAIVPRLKVFLEPQDIVLYRGQLYALSFGTSLFSILVEDVAGEPTVSQVSKVVNALWRRPWLGPHMPSFYLLESGGRLLMINEQIGPPPLPPPGGIASAATRTPTHKFVVYVAMFKQSRWGTPRNKHNLLQVVPDNVVLFLGPWCSRSVAIPADQRRSYNVMGGCSIVFFSDHGDGGAADYHRKGVSTFDCSVYYITTARSQSLLRTSVRPLKGFPATWLFPPIRSCEA